MDDRLVDAWPWLTRTRGVVLLADVAALAAAAVLVARPADGSAVVAAAVLGVLATVLTGLHRPRLRQRVRPQVARLGLAALTATATLVAGDALSLSQPGRVVTHLVVGWALLVGLRAVALAHVRSRRRSGRRARAVVVVGTGSVARKVADGLLADRELGLVPVGLVADGPPRAASAPGPDRGLPLLGGLDRLATALHDLGVDDVVFAFPEPPGAAGIAAVDEALAAGHGVLVVPHFFELAGRERARGVERVGGVDLVALDGSERGPHLRLLQRGADMLVGTVALVLTSPLLAVLVVALRLELGSRVLGRRVRTGRDGRQHVQHRLRTVRTPTFDSRSTAWRFDAGARTGPVGRVVRRTRLDALPRLLDLVSGQAGLAVPRPARPLFVGEVPRERPAGTEDVLSGPGAPPPGAGRPGTARALR